MKQPTLEQLIAKWKFSAVNPKITAKNFPPPKEIKTDFKLYHFNYGISSEDAIKEMKKDGYRSVNLYELLSWKDWNKRDLVVALGQVEGDSVPCLYRHDAGRDLLLHWCEDVWNVDYRFLGTTTE